MTCYNPVKAYKSIQKNINNKSIITFKAPADLCSYSQIYIPCGGCIGCRIDRSRQWALRCVHEASLHSTNSFITLTYNDENLPEGGSLIPRQFTLFTSLS